MKTKKKVLIGLMALCLAGTVGSALALTRTGTTGTATSPAFDSAIYLYWDAESQTSANLTDIASMSVNTPVYRYLTVSPKSSKSVSGTVTLTFTLAAADGKVVTGLTVAVYDSGSTAVNDSNKATVCVDANKLFTLQTGALSNTATFSVTTNSNIHTTTNYYAIAVNYDGTAPHDQTLGGTVTISQNFA